MIVKAQQHPLRLCVQSDEALATGHGAVFKPRLVQLNCLSVRGRLDDLFHR